MQTDNTPLSDEVKKAIGERLREERERLKLSQPSFGEAGGVMRGAQIKYEGGSRVPDAEYLKRVAAIGADVLYIITGERSENTATTPMELSYLRICRALPDNSARMAGNAALVGLMSAYSTQLNTSNDSNENIRHAAQKGESYGNDN